MTTERNIRLTVNGKAYESLVPVRMTLVDFLRGELDLTRSEEHTSELQSRTNLVCRLLLEKKKKSKKNLKKNKQKKQTKKKKKKQQML